MHRSAAAIDDAFQQHFIRCRLGGDDALVGSGVDGDDVLHDWLPVSPIGGASLGKLLISERFGMSARQSGKWFRAWENCFVVATATKHSR